MNSNETRKVSIIKALAQSTSLKNQSLHIGLAKKSQSNSATLNNSKAAQEILKQISKKKK